MNPSPANTAPTHTRFLVLAGLCAAAALSYVSRNAIAVAESTVRADLELTKEQSGWLMSAFFISYSVCQIPGAWVGQRFGARRALPAFAVVWSIATAATALGGFVNVLLMRVVKGVSQGGLFPICTGVVAKWFPKTGQAFATGALGSFMSVGGAVGAALTGWLVVEIGWRWMFVLYSLPGLLWAAWFWGWFRETPSEHGAVNAAEAELISPRAGGLQPPSVAPAAEQTGDCKSPARAEAPPIPWLQLLTSPAMWCICGQQFFRAAGYMFFTSWFATYLQEARGVTILKSGFLTMLPLLAVVVGSLAGGVISDTVLKRTGSRRLARQGVAVASLGLCAGLTLSAYFFADALAAVLIISAGSFFAAVAGPCGYTITIDMGGAHVPTVNSVMNMTGNFGAMLFPLAVPLLLGKEQNWNVVLVTFGALYLGSALCWWLLKPEGTVFEQALVRAKSDSQP
ncbi:MAG: sugar phosphate permease [Limisphaerales bacterium]|nr:MAG: sugar phosphate permease [Limisphaerales bacterium]KAG0508332.1 MAG: sugar phosphate permease [Limisphaerales bacterium]TXT49647.1 MAG: sugar phosphate permease [Limisphaerales bacterium]